MRELRTEGPATHRDPEPCGGVPQGRSRRVGRGTRRRAMEPRNGQNGEPTSRGAGAAGCSTAGCRTREAATSPAAPGRRAARRPPCVPAPLDQQSRESGRSRTSTARHPRPAGTGPTRRPQPSSIGVPRTASAGPCSMASASRHRVRGQWQARLLAALGKRIEDQHRSDSTVQEEHYIVLST